MKNYFYAVMHIISSIAFKAVYTLAQRVGKQLTDNAATFPDADPTPADILAESKRLGELIGQAKGNTLKTTERNEQCVKVHGMLKDELVYINKIAKGSKSIVELSGFEADLEPSPKPVPDAIVIKRIVTGKENATAKVYIIASKISKFYIVQITTTPNVESSWKTVVQLSNSRKLIIPGLTKGVEISVRIAGTNSAGQGSWSSPMGFIPQ